LKRRLHVLNLALLALIAGASWQLRRQWVESGARKEKVFEQQPAAASTVREPVLQPPQPVTAARYSKVAEEMLFSKDRNPNVLIEVAPPKPVPPLPVAHGIVNFGGGPMVIFSEKPGAPQRGFSPGEKVGEFALVAVNNGEIVLEWEGQRVTKRLEELLDQSVNKSAEASERTERTRATQSQNAKPVTSPANPTGPGVVIAGEVRACVQGDSSPPGTVVNGLRKVVTETPFGKVCRWEPLH
jgi:hypothetical protein